MTITSTLTELDGGEERLIRLPPYGILHTLGLDNDYSPYFGLRTVTLPKPGCRGGRVQQALVDYLGSPAWINVSFES